MTKKIKNQESEQAKVNFEEMANIVRKNSEIMDGKSDGGSILYIHIDTNDETIYISSGNRANLVPAISELCKRDKSLKEILQLALSI